MFPPNQALILRVLAIDPSREFAMSELATAIGRKAGAIQRSLNTLVAAGYVEERRRANLRLLCYGGSHPLQEEIRRIVIHDAALPADIAVQYPAAAGSAACVAEPRGDYDTSALKILMIAGPNGAGKTTFANEYLRNEARCLLFINADYIAHGLSPFAPGTVALKAGRVMLGELDEHIRRRRNLAVETTLSGRRYARLIPDWQVMGYKVKLIFLDLVSADLAVARVGTRIRQGGHPIDEDTIRRRYEAGRRNFHTVYRQLVDAWALYDNSADRPVLIEEDER